MFNIDSLILEQVVFELRYESAYLYWDNSGKIFNEILKGWPSASVESVTVQEAQIILKDEGITLKFSPQQINFTQQYPENIKAIGEFADYALPIITKHLDASVFSRVGNRFFYSLKVADSEASNELLQRTGFFTVPSDKLKKIGNSIKSPHIRFTVTRDDEIGYIFNMAHVTRNLEIQVSKPVKFDMSKFVKTALLIDIDFHTLKPVECGNIKSFDLIKKNKKDIEYFIKELFQ